MSGDDIPLHSLTLLQVPVSPVMFVGSWPYQDFSLIPKLFLLLSSTLSVMTSRGQASVCMALSQPRCVGDFG